jgi:hypothetical protein
MTIGEKWAKNDKENTERKREGENIKNRNIENCREKGTEKGKEGEI